MNAVGGFWRRNGGVQGMARAVRGKRGAGLCFGAFCELKMGHAGGRPSQGHEARCRARSKKQMSPFGDIRFLIFYRCQLAVAIPAGMTWTFELRSSRSVKALTDSMVTLRVPFSAGSSRVVPVAAPRRA